MKNPILQGVAIVGTFIIASVALVIIYTSAVQSQAPTDTLAAPAGGDILNPGNSSGGGTNDPAHITSSSSSTKGGTTTGQKPPASSSSSSQGSIAIDHAKPANKPVPGNPSVCGGGSASACLNPAPKSNGDTVGTICTCVQRSTGDCSCIWIKRAEGQSCVSNDNCQSGLTCQSSVCKAKTAPVATDNDDNIVAPKPDTTPTVVANTPAQNFHTVFAEVVELEDGAAEYTTANQQLAAQIIGLFASQANFWASISGGYSSL